MIDKPDLAAQGLRRVHLDDGRSVLVDLDDPHTDEQIQAFYRTEEPS
jgi:hypothetical protein